MEYVRISIAADRTGLHPNMLRKYADNGTVPSHRTPSGQRWLAVNHWLRNGNPQLARPLDDLDKMRELVRQHKELWPVFRPHILPTGRLVIPLGKGFTVRCRVRDPIMVHLTSYLVKRSLKIWLGLAG